MPREANSPGWVRGFLNLYVLIPAGTGAVEIITNLNPPWRFHVERVTAAVAIVGAGAGASRTVRVRKGAVVVASGTLTLANTATLGALVPLAVVAGTTEFNDPDPISVDFAAGGTAFTGGAVNLVIEYRTRAQQLG